VAAVVTGLMAKSEHDDAKASCSPGCTNDELSAGRTLAITNTVLVGVAVVSVGVGVVLLLTGDSEPSPQPADSTPEVSLGAGPRGASAQATWRF
jgi:hypothetical protein